MLSMYVLMSLEGAWTYCVFIESFYFLFFFLHGDSSQNSRSVKVMSSLMVYEGMMDNFF